MKRQEDFGVGTSLSITFIFALMAIYSYQQDEGTVAMFPTIGALFGIIMSIGAILHASNKSAKEEQQQNAEKSIKYDSSIGQEDLKLYFDSSSKKLTICATTTKTAKQETIDDFQKDLVIETDSYIVALDTYNHKILRVNNQSGNISKKICRYDEDLKSLGIIHNESTPSLKAYGDYAFVTDDINQFVAIVTPTTIRVLRYSDIVSISYEENGSDVFNKSLGGAVAGGLIFGGVGAIVGGSTAKAKQNKEVKEMSIKILLKSTSDPTIILTIYKGAELKTKNSADRTFYEGLMKEVSGIKDIFSIIIDIVEKDSAINKSKSVSQQQSSTSVADELLKLAKLKESGIISEEEFNIQKAKLLNL